MEQIADRIPADLPVVILCGGKGTRIREASESLPKPMIDIGGRPILWHIMKHYHHHGARRFVLCLGHLSNVIKDYFLEYQERSDDFTLQLRTSEKTFHSRSAPEDWEITFAETGPESGTGGRLLLVKEYVDTDRFLFTYGDGIGDVDLTALYNFHLERGLVGTVTGVHPTSRFGEIHVRDGVAEEFNEKPAAEGFVSGGFFVFEKKIFDYLGDDPGVFLEAAPLRDLARDSELAVFEHLGFWMGMDTYRDWQELNRMWADGDAPWRSW